MHGKMFVKVAVIIALVLGVLAAFAPAMEIRFMLPIMRFFQAMIPVLGVAALLKYLTGCGA